MSKIRLREVAEAAGVSRAAASLVLNDGDIRISDRKRDEIRNAAARLGYRPHTAARRLARRKTDCISLVFSNEPGALASLFAFEVTHHIATAARAHGYDLMLDFVHSAKPDSLARDPTRVDGTLLVHDRNSANGLEQALTDSPLPSLVIGGGFTPTPPCCFVDFDIRDGARQATRHLVELGHRAIRFLGSIPSPEKFEGYTQAMTEAGHEPEPAHVVDGVLSESAVDAQLDVILSRPRPPTAIVAANDTLAIRLVRVLHRRGLHVPRDISVVGFDDIETAAMIIPSLTTVHIPLRDLAEVSLRGLVDQIENNNREPVHTLLPTRLVVRESSGPPPA